jgi:hypothetical protein
MLIVEQIYIVIVRVVDACKQELISVVTNTITCRAGYPDNIHINSIVADVGFGFEIQATLIKKSYKNG